MCLVSLADSSYSYKRKLNFLERMWNILYILQILHKAPYSHGEQVVHWWFTVTIHVIRRCQLPQTFISCNRYFSRLRTIRQGNVIKAKRLAKLKHIEDRLSFASQFKTINWYLHTSFGLLGRDPCYMFRNLTLPFCRNESWLVNLMPDQRKLLLRQLFCFQNDVIIKLTWSSLSEISMALLIRLKRLL